MNQAAYSSQQQLLTGVDVAGFSKVFSTMWGGSLYGRFEASAVFMVLLSLCNRDGVVDMTPEAIAGATGWPLKIIRKGIDELAAADERSRTPDEEGRRILLIDDHRDWGWRITNYQKYRDQMRSMERREYLRQAKQKEREKKRSTAVNTSTNDNRVQPIAEADTEAEADKPLGRSRASKRCPSDFEITDNMQVWATNKNFTSEFIADQTEIFRNHEFKTARKDWPACWRNWLLRAKEYENDRKRRSVGKPSFEDRTAKLRDRAGLPPV